MVGIASLLAKRQGDRNPDSGLRSAWNILWRRVLRDTKRIADLKTRAETRKMARDEFERNKDVKDISQIKYLISTGKSQWDATERYIDGL
ncbi:hypothetical protein V501_01511 [Pseudogymnoascus sp. VKM F-4519 (FW-2642)]|nr:hypothetical protein V501_01511 [Pseudogymnoascus sp. VKM F-4519 (FW-2642)]